MTAQVTRKEHDDFVAKWVAPLYGGLTQHLLSLNLKENKKNKISLYKLTTQVDDIKQGIAGISSPSVDEITALYNIFNANISNAEANAEDKTKVLAFIEEREKSKQMNDTQKLAITKLRELCGLLPKKKSTWMGGWTL